MNIFNNYIRAPLPRFSTAGAVISADRAEGIAGALGKGQQISFSISKPFLTLFFLLDQNIEPQGTVSSMSNPRHSCL